jgi:methylmalonyl-CoA mutase N-terminal domain/subunit
LALPTERAALVALRTQQIIAHETGVTNTVDPLGGSYFIERLTKELEEEAWEYFRKIDAMGGMIEAIEAGFPQKEIHESAYQFQRAVERKEKIIVGVNEYEMEGHELGEPNILQIDESVARLQAERLQHLRAERDQGMAERALDALRRGAEDPNTNTMPLLIDCARADCTLGEMCDALRPIFGEYQEPDF